MITTVGFRPPWLCSAYNPITWSFLSNKITELDFQYVIDVWINGVNVARLKQRPNPTGYGIVDVANIVQPYLETSKFTQGELETNQPFWTNQEASAHVYIKVGEQYGPNQTIYVGSSDTPGNPAFSIYSAYTNATVGLTNVETRVINAALENHEWRWNFQDAIDAEIWSNNPYNDGKSSDHSYAPTKLAIPMSKQNSVRDVFYFDKATLTFINWVPGAGLSNANNVADRRAIYGFRYTIVDPFGTITTHDEIPTTANGFGPRTTCSASLATQLDNSFDLIHLQMDPERIATLTGEPLTEGWSYSVQGYNLGESSCTLGVPITEKVDYYIAPYCELVWPRVRLSWLNELAGRDYWNFTMQAQKEVSTETGYYYQDIVNWSGSTPVPQVNSTTPYGTLPMQGGDKVYDKTATTRYKLTTDWIDESDIKIFEGLQKSPQVLAYFRKEVADQFTAGSPASITLEFPAWVPNSTTGSVWSITIISNGVGYPLIINQGVSTEADSAAFFAAWVEPELEILFGTFGVNYTWQNLGTEDQAIFSITAVNNGPEWNFKIADDDGTIEQVSSTPGVADWTRPGVSIYDRMPYQVKILNQNYVVRNTKQTKLVAVEYDIEINQIQTMQNQ